jgi:hypothetical protein
MVQDRYSAAVTLPKCIISRSASDQLFMAFAVFMPIA